jgi:uncharacterized protein
MKTYSLITGASGGIGSDLARILANDKHNLVLIARNEAKLNEIKISLENEFGIDVIVYAIDLSVPDAAEKLFENILKENIQINILINNAGFGDFSAFAESDMAKQEMMINLNILALAKLTRLFLPEMIKSGNGRILNVASVAAFMPGPLMSVYYASKSFVLSFSYAISNELKGSGVTVTVLCPGPTDTGFVEAASLGESKLFKIMKPVPSSEVAKYAYRYMMKGRLLAIPGFMNKIMWTAVRFSPRKTLTSVVRKIQEK